MLVRLGAVLCCLSWLVAGCGDSRTPLPNPAQPESPTAFQQLQYPSAGVELQAPSNWSVSTQRAPLVSILSSGSAVVALWRYPRGAPAPSGAAALRLAAARLVAAARARDPTLQLIKATPLTIQNVSAIELDAIERIGGQVRRVRSTHLFVPGAELVLDEYAAPAVFHSVDHSVFSPVKRSLRLLAGGRA